MPKEVSCRARILTQVSGPEATGCLEWPRSSPWPTVPVDPVSSDPDSASFLPQQVDRPLSQARGTAHEQGELAGASHVQLREVTGVQLGDPGK